MPLIRIGTRKSPLAMAQSKWMADQIRQRGFGVEMVGILTEGDRAGPSATALPRWGGKGMFVKALDEALLDGRIDLAIHSAKDVPSELSPGLDAAAIPVREDPADTLVSAEGWTLETIPKGARVGTASLRRSAQIRFFRQDVTIVSVRGNVETRLKKIGTDCDAVALAMAGLRRLGNASLLKPMSLRAERLDPAEFLPAPGQGTLMAISRAADASRFSFLSDPTTTGALAIEREFVRRMGADCNWPIGAWARLEKGSWHVSAAILSVEGKLRAFEKIEGDDKEKLAELISDRVLAKGGKKILAWNQRIESRHGGAAS